MGSVLRPTASEVRNLLQRIKVENVERGLSLISAANELQFDPANLIQNPSSVNVSSNCRRSINETSFPTFATTPTDESERFRNFEDLQMLLSRCSKELESFPPPLKRYWRQMRSVFPKSGTAKEEENIRVFQWNVLSQSLGTQNDNFTRCPPPALDWRFRRFRMLEEIARHDPDVVCLQEVDHFQFLQNSLWNIGYVGHFKPKPDSPCIHLPRNNGPDGCAIFYKQHKFELTKLESRVLQIWGVPSNQVALTVTLQSKSTGFEFVVANTHLKARKGPLMAAMRNEQAADLIEHIKRFAFGKPVICSGDFNAEPDEPLHQTLTKPDELGLSSAYDPNMYTSWKFRGDHECKETLDYIFASQDRFRVEGVLESASEAEIGINLLPSLSFASDHLSLVADLKVIIDVENEMTDFV